MPAVSRVLDPNPVGSLEAYIAGGGGEGLQAARKLGAIATIEEVEAAGLRGRGGAGFPTGRKWRTVREYASDAVPTTVVVNAAEGEPGSFKDRMLLRTNPYRVLEGACIAALAVGADRIIVGLKASFTSEAQRTREAAAELAAAGWADGVDIEVFDGPGEYLYGEETALLEVLSGGPPLPRLAPPYRHGADEVGAATESRSVAGTDLATEDDSSPAPPTLVNNVETLANVPGILAEGPDWFRECGTVESPGTIVCTVAGSVRHQRVGEYPMGTPLSEVIAELGGGPRRDRTIVAAISGVANPVLPASHFDTPLTHEAMAEAGSGLGAAGFIVLDDSDDPVAFAHGASRFLAVESCGQCTPCKQDGLAIADLLDRIRRSSATPYDLLALDDRLRTVTDEARCNLALQHQRVVNSLLTEFGSTFRAHVDGTRPETAEMPVVPIVDLADGKAVLDLTQLEKQPDWTHQPSDSGKAPADRLTAGSPTRATG
jgi:NADH-quinone oxidoreductase subunit F